MTGGGGGTSASKIVMVCSDPAGGRTVVRSAQFLDHQAGLTQDLTMHLDDGGDAMGIRLNDQTRKPCAGLLISIASESV